MAGPVAAALGRVRGGIHGGSGTEVQAVSKAKGARSASIAEWLGPMQDVAARFGELGRCMVIILLLGC